MKTFTLAILAAFATVTMTVSARAAGMFNTDFTITTLGGVKITKSSLEQALSSRFKKSAKIQNIYRTWGTWSPDYVFQDFLSTHMFSRQVNIFLSNPQNKKDLAIVICTLNVMDSGKTYRASLNDCQAVSEDSHKTMSVDITRDVLSHSQRVAQN